LQQSILAERPSSRPARGAWIETATNIDAFTAQVVAPRAGRVD